MNVNAVRTGLRIRVTSLGPTTGMLITAKYLEARQEGVTGIVGTYVAGHGGDVWWVQHDGGVIGAYSFSEMEPLEDQTAPDPTEVEAVRPKNLWD